MTTALNAVLTTLGGFSPTTLVLLVALGAMALAAFAISAVVSIAKQGKRHP
jgi:hypothetical protein